jgi:hypothetical protein
MTPTSATNEIMRIMLEMKNRIVQATSSPIRHASVRT